MTKDIDMKGRVVSFWDIDTGDYEDEIVKYLDKHMKVRFHSAAFNNALYTFKGSPSEQSSNSITVSSYGRKNGNNSIVIE